ncbi:ribosome 60S biogenesis N-terminal-domain-containing protein [Annulohypoxylon maeteangense]|uniref:ribosome 60S biogenesis N-terminal-domain-containing protein n=1 Tax=Annulohypoxylon maeteangense TaxID=1927788 RepID=UPI0020074620|nr:ribosome 60S biogenesis N-terminal-domain-containing protein [Annulohypoxylon maeteangense]KAI0889010.1 ribosome 60S biogenesis N-terminal-domain-containing protein [Annulohypoxylon maeteangense]
MAKRKSYGGEGGHSGKKQKTAHVHDPPTSEEIYNGRQLRQLLAFEQDLRQARHGLQSFKNLLDSIVNGEDENSEKQQILLEYLEAVKPRERDDEVPVYLPDIMETWGMAVQMNNENVMSAVAVILALLLKVLSANVDHVSYGLGICRTLLQKRQQESIAKNLSADNGKDFIISPTLRLLREVVCLDGGTLAAPTFRARNYTFKSLARNMGLRYLGEGVEDPKRPSVRTNAIRFLLGSLRLLYVEAKRDLLSQKDIVAALMRHIRKDPPSLIYEILNTLRSSVILDKKLPKEIKIRILNAYSLIRIAELYGHPEDVTEQEGESEGERPSVEDSAHAFLLAACTDSDAGIRRSEHGYYPDGVDPNAAPSSANDDQPVDFGIDSIPWMSKFENDVPVRNMLLAEFIQTLRPWSSTKQNDLLVAIFEKSPELIAHYFCHRKSFSFDPKLTATWIGYAALLYNAVQLPIPSFFGHAKGYARVPPPTSVVLGNIIPLPMTLKAITRCFSIKSKLASFYAIRLLTLSIQKLGRALEMYREASPSSDSLWEEAARRLLDDFYQRIPDMKDIIKCYLAMDQNDLLQRQAASRLLLLYYEVIPQFSLRAKFDVSPILLSTIKKVETSEETGEDMVMSLLELENLCAIAKYSPNMRWFARTSDMSHSPFTTLLRLSVEKTTGLSNESLGNVLYWVASEHQLVENRPNSQGLYPLIAALRSLENIDPAIWTFLDNCAERCARTPVKYLEMIEEQLEKAKVAEDKNVITCPLMMTIAEQLPYLISSSPSKTTLKELVQFLSEYLGYSLASGVNKRFLKATKELLASGLGEQKKLGAKLRILEREISTSETQNNSHQDTTTVTNGLVNGVINGTDNDSDHEISPHGLEQRLSVPIIVTKDSSLSRWTSKTPEELVEEGYAASLIRLLLSEHSSIRKEALTSIVKVAAKVKESTYENNEQVWLLLMELAESARSLIDNGPLSSMIVTFACKALEVLSNPLHCLYEKINLFLTSRPVWSLDRIPLMQNILQEGPTDDGAFYSEISWLLSFLLDSLRTPADIALFHQRKVFERLFALTCNPFMGPNLRTQILRIVYRTTTIEGGSDTLITRFGTVSWVLAQRDTTTDADERAIYQALLGRLWNTCDQKRISEWSKGGLERLVA